MWISMSRKEERICTLKCIAFGTACMALLLGMMVWM